MSDKVVGGDYKFNDYYSVFKQPAAEAIDLRTDVVTGEDLPRLRKEYHITLKEINLIKENLIAMIKAV